VATVRLGVITPTIPGRESLLAEAVLSVAGQQPVRGVEVVHAVAADHERSGPAVVRNRVAQSLDVTHLAFLDDDDVWEPHHLATVLPALARADVAATLATIEGRRRWDPQLAKFDPDAMRHANFLPLCGAVVPADLFASVDGFPADGRLYEDWGLWLALLDRGARFEIVPQRTWRYRFGAWDSRSREVWDGRRKASV
jgi:hypothetical protein